jgi:phosphoglycerate kinase
MRPLRKARINPGQRVLLRTDFDVPLRKNRITDDFRLEAALSTIKFLLNKKARLIIAAHLARPLGKVVPELSLKPVAQWLKERLGIKIVLIKKISPREFDSGQVFILENLRFFPGEETNDLKLAKNLASMADIFVNDAFAVSHRKHASIVGVPQFLPSFAGLRLEKEIKSLKRALKAEHDLVVILGGAKTKTKIPAIKSLVKIGAVVLLGGTIANTFLAALLGEDKVNGSIIDKERLGLAANFLKNLDLPVSFSKIPGKTTKIWLPLDVIVGFPLETISLFPEGESVPKDKLVFDIGEKTVKEYTSLLQFAQAIICNGPLGKIEEERFCHGSKKVFQAVADSSAFSIVGGGDTIAALEKFNLVDKMDLVSTGGGAMLDFLSHGSLPGIEALKK